MADTAPDQLFLAFQLAVAGRYSIDRELGRGGMGIVFLAREVHLDRLVAIKLLPPDKAADESLRARFLREARLAAKLSHPNIIPIHSVEERDGFVFFVMSFIDGETLTQRVRARGPLSISDGARVLREVAWALAYAHGQGIIHRDVKPDNILLEAPSGRALVADFGIAAVPSDTAPVARAGAAPLAQGLTAAGAITGTPEFMSPEQCLGELLDPRSDLYSLGAAAFFMFSGRFPFEGKNPTEILAKHITEPAPPLGTIGRSVPRKLAAIVDRCLAKDPAHRPADANVVAEQLGMALEQRRELPVALRSFVKRARLNGAGTLAAGVVLLPTSVSVSAWLGIGAGWSTFVLGALGGPVAYMVLAARRVLMVGFQHPDVAPAFKAEIEQSREELGGGLAQPESRIERLLHRTAKISWPLYGVTLAMLILNEGLGMRVFIDSPVFWVPYFATGVAAIGSLMGLLVVGGRRRDIDTEFWSRVWMGRIGRAAFAVARRLTGGRAHVTSMTHRATELSLGMAADQLYQSLPKATRDALGNLPEVLRQLQDNAQALRERLDKLQEALNDAGDASASTEYADVREMRDHVHARLGDAVAALETIRLNLLRLHAGSATIASLTTHLDVAAEMADQLRRMISAQSEVNKALQFPRAATPTPV